jgi:hypothetical protein
MVLTWRMVAVVSTPSCTQCGGGGWAIALGDNLNLLWWA